MTDKKTWLITGAGRGMGVDIARAALAAGHCVVATGRSTDAVANAVGKTEDLLVAELDITSPASAEAAVRAAAPFQVIPSTVWISTTRTCCGATCRTTR